MYDFQEQFFQMMSRVKEAERSRAASTPPKDDARITEIVNGLIVTRPAKKVTEITEIKTNESESAPEIIDLQAHAKSKLLLFQVSIN